MIFCQTQITKQVYCSTKIVLKKIFRPLHYKLSKWKLHHWFQVGLIAQLPYHY